MANKNTLEIIIKANATQAVSALNKLQATVSKPFSGLQQQVGALGSAFTSVTGISLGAAGAFAALGMAASKASDFIKSSVAETIAYAQSVRELSYVLGTSAEETSRIVQVADDYLISVEKLSTALRFAVKNGFEPSIESLAQLSDQFNAIQDPNERAAKMVEIFGRNWSALVPLLKAGGDAIRENAAAINDALIITEAGQDAIFEYQQSLDNLGDSVQAVKTSIGMALVPALNDALGIINQLTPALNLLDDVMGGNVVSAYSLAAALALLRGDFTLEGFAESARLLNQGFEATQTAAKDAEIALGDYGQRLKEINGTQKEATDAVDDSSDALKDYAKTITKLGLSTAQENDLIAQFAANLGGVDVSALIAANDMDLLDAAIAANVITLEQYTALSLQAAQGTGELDDTTRAYLDAQLAMAEGQTGVTNALKGTANAATLVRDQLVNVIGLAEQLRFAGPREVRTQIFEQLKSLLTDIDPAKANALATGIKDIGLAFGVFNANDLAVAEAIPQFVEQLGALKIDPSNFAEAVQGFLDAVRNTRMTGEPIDISSILDQFAPAPEQISALAEEYKDIMPAIQEAVQSSTETGITLDTNPILEQFAATPEDITAIQESYEPLKSLPQELVDSWAVLTGDEGASVLAQPLNEIATAIGVYGENAGTAQTNVAGVAIQTGIMAENSDILNTELATLPTKMQLLGQTAAGAYSPMRALAGVIGNVATSAAKATGAVQALAAAIAGLSSKTITITVNFDVGAFPNIPGGGGGQFEMMASGGKVNPLKKYIIGEEGPELFIPKTAGQIIPADVTQAAILAAMGLSSDSGETPSGSNRRRRSPRKTEGGGPPTPSGPVVSGYVPQPTAPQFMGANFDAYLDLFQPPFSVDAPPPAPEPERRRDRGGRPTSGQWRNQQKALQSALEQTYQPLGSNLFQPDSQTQGDLSQGSATSATETERIGKNVTYNNYFPVQKIEDELDARDLARKVAAELARMPSR